MMPLSSKTIMELIKVYKSFPCLWDNTNLHYNNKAARKKAYEVIFNTIKMYNEDITLKLMKKKIENMRTTCKREAKKIKAERESGNLDYRPTLWYYDEMLFLNNQSDGGSSPGTLTIRDVDDEGNEDSETGYVYEEYLEEEPKPKRSKTSNIFLSEHRNELSVKPETSNAMPNISGVFLPSHGNDEAVINNDNNEALAFGKTIGLQLNELNSLQRAVAEKLISETIFYGRLNKLQPNSSIKLDSE